jgi:hypothetical protein
VLEFEHNSHILLKNFANMKDKDANWWILYITAGNCWCCAWCKSLEPGLGLLFFKFQDVMFLRGQVVSISPKPPTWRTRSLYLWTPETFLASSLTEGLWSTSCSDRFNTGTGTCTHCMEQWVHTRAHVGVCTIILKTHTHSSVTNLQTYQISRTRDITAHVSLKKKRILLAAAVRSLLRHLRIFKSYHYMSLLSYLKNW